MLGDGLVLVAGGYDDSMTGNFSDPMPITYNASAELYNPATNGWSVTGSMAAGRRDQTATLLGNGQVLVTGGSGPTTLGYSSAETFNPLTGTWSGAGDMQRRSRFSYSGLVE